MLHAALELARRDRLAELCADAAAAGGAAPGRRRAGRRAASSASTRRACACSSSVGPGAAPRRRASRRRRARRSAVFAQHDGGAQRRRDVGQRHPGPRRTVVSTRTRCSDVAVAVEQRDVGRAVRRAAPRRSRDARRPPRRRERGASSAAAARTQREHASFASRRTSTPRSAVSPNISGAYIASTRVGGSANSPDVVQAHRVLDACHALGQELVVAAEGLEAALLERRPGRLPARFSPCVAICESRPRPPPRMVAPPGTGSLTTTQVMSALASTSSAHAQHVAARLAAGLTACSTGVTVLRHA